MDENNDLSASVVRNLDVVEAAYRHLQRVDERLLEATMCYLSEVTDSIEWHLSGMDKNADQQGFDNHWLCPTAWVSTANPDETEIYFDICAVGPEFEDLHWTTCFTGALGDEAGAAIKLEFPKLPKRNGNRNFLAREDVTREVSALGWEIDGTEVMCRFIIDRETLSKAFESDDGEDLSEGFRLALAPLGDKIHSIDKKLGAWNAFRGKIVAAVDE